MNDYKERLEQEYDLLREYIINAGKFRAERQRDAEKNNALHLRVQASRAAANKAVQRARVLRQEARERRESVTDKTLNQRKNPNKSGGEHLFYLNPLLLDKLTARFPLSPSSYAPIRSCFNRRGHFRFESTRI